MVAGPRVEEHVVTIRLDDTIAVVTGAAGGIGRAVCASMAEAGATVVATDLAPEAAVPGGRVPGAIAYRQHDVSKEADWAKIATEIRTKYGRLDALVNAAAICQVKTIEETTLEDWRRLMAINIDSMLIGTQATLPLLRESGKTRKGGASIVNFSSVGGQRGAAFTAAYCTSKGAVKLFSKSCAIEFGMLKYNIRVNSVHPGGIHTPMMHAIIDRYVQMGGVPSREAAEAGVIAAHPIGRLGNPEEIGGGVVYLCSPEASFVT